MEGLRITVRRYDVRFGEVVQEARGKTRIATILRSVLRPGGIFLDVGANHGVYSLLAGKLVGPSGRVFAFEANPGLADCVRASLDANLRCDHAVFQVALTDVRGTVDFYFDPIGSGQGSLFEAFAGKRALSTRVTAEQLDEVVPTDISGDVVVKLDIEGAELAALRGGRRLLAERRPTIIFESNPASAAAAGTSVEQIVRFLSDLGYHTFADSRFYPQTCAAADLDLSRQGDIVAIFT